MLLVMVTYTHNDAELLNGLLASIRRWSLKPAHVFIVDDASEPAYGLPGDLKGNFGGSAALSAQASEPGDFAQSGQAQGREEVWGEAQNLPGLDIVRPGKHLGPAQAKSFGIDLAFDAGADAVLSIDCDVRLPKHWLKEALSMAGEKKVGLVGSDLGHGLAGDVLSDYLREFEAVPHGIVETEFLGAGVWLLRKDVWAAAGGLSGHTQYTHEDLYFSNALRSLGYRLVAHNEPPPSQVRRLRARSHFNRQLCYLGFAVLGVSKSKGPDAALSLVAEQARARLERGAALNKSAFFYIELLWMSSLLFYLASRGATGENPGFAGRDVGNELWALLKDYPETRALLQEDLAAMGLAGKKFTPLNLPRQEPEPDQESVNRESGTPSEPEENGKAGALARAVFSLWHNYPEQMQALEAGEVSRLRRENKEMEFALHYLE